ncbi:hypothetical protein GUITHDRAFT_147508 [Guillardia theta CCMP2712]|uniref:O-phosphoseryl-tRNA(Sec) selenium transferase n=2 Tax=Guillardia theta TaxID=55529 RepID=L1IDR3_GUITC|nr:hypothetical protein GUITHDRAFT_147508 [Guillardia theta CCMP2712]EKX34049.1 hypothetical protein GUITHDRAFT_147508 [Guillardia theta CCMP2712]|mmetsp:Transcript_40619/g.128099  ORF Transcript_40619/g.128099 Transcript_40619/m.128099 type:complete len:481 (+) Transcript_40619:178-1620(+)|eukprot:XP_005821029.1 hypothetical protein GUITHDRAFT_147508 [Guillardia theta CCMP2712]
MNPTNFELAEGLISSRYIKQALEARNKRDNLVKSLLSQRRMPEDGWDDQQIVFFLQNLSAMDSNNFVDNIGVGEREGRIFNRLVSERYYGMSHGVGRSGDLTAEQPKAAGSSLLGKLANLMVMDALKIAGMHNVSSCAVLPVATGMAITLSLMGISSARPGAKKVIWPRVDQKTCLKSLLAMGLTPIIIENMLEGDEVVADMNAIEQAIIEHGPDNILTVIATTSCFAPRRPERIVAIAELCKKHEVPLLVNNAYGCQSRVNMKSIASACQRGRIDGIVQSTDKNFMVPVGGAILATVNRNDDLVKAVASLYPGRASCSAVQDLFITLLSMGRRGYQKLLEEREEMLAYMFSKVGEVAQQHGERMLNTSGNGISLAMTLDSYVAMVGKPGVSQLGSMLFARSCSGTRVVTCVKEERVGGIAFQGYGAHMSNYPCAYLSFACAIGIQKEEVDLFAERLGKTLKEFRKKCEKKEGGKEEKQE